LTCHTRGQKQDARDQNWNRIKINKEFKKIWVNCRPIRNRFLTCIENGQFENQFCKRNVILIREIFDWRIPRTPTIL
jgi:hypothetical protein